MKTIGIYISVFILLFFASCADQDFIGNASSGTQSDGCCFTVSIPAPIETNTRAIGDALTEEYVIKSLPMHVLVFDENGFFFAFQKATVESFTANDNGGGEGTYTVKLPVSNTPCALHFVLGNVADFENPQYTASDSETSIFSQLTVGDNEDVYWQRVEVDNILKDESGQVSSLAGKTIKLVRNFVQISVDVVKSDDFPENFELIGFTVINHINRGTVAPYSGSEENGGFALYEKEDGAVLSYDDFRELNPGFGGCNPPRDISSLQGVIPPAENNDTYFTTTGSVYVYERNQDDASNPAYLLLKARYNDEICYYKLDIVSFDKDTYVTSYFNLYRNFHYKLHITSVSDKGYDTPQEATNAVASNNIGASVEISNVNEIRYGENSLRVEELDIMIVSTDAHTLDYNYVHEGEPHNGTDYVKVTPVGGNDEGGYNHNAVKEIKCNADGTITITPVDPLPDVMETQEFIVAGKSGLSRRVTVRVRKPFELIADCDDVVEQEIGADLTLIVRLPDNMPTSVFPLDLYIESEKKSLYPDVNANRIPVGSHGNYTFNYVATVDYNVYRLNHTQFIHFKTNMAESATNIKVTNSYFLDTSNVPEPAQNNVAVFTNVAVGHKHDFGEVTLTSGNASNTGTPETPLLFPDCWTNKTEVQLTFSLPCGSTEHLDADHPIEIFADYFYLDPNGENAPQTTTGTYTMRGDGQCIFYTPNSVTGEQSITFTINRNFASETIQLSSYDHSTVTIDYTSEPLNLYFKYEYEEYQWGWPSGSYETVQYPVSRNATISLYNDSDYSNLVEQYRVNNNNGQITIESLVGFDENSTLYFSYTHNRKGDEEANGTYYGSVTVSDLVGGGTGTTERNPIVLRKDY